MEKLREAGLKDGGLVTLSGSLAGRYNDCLALLGVGPTSLSAFSIDGMGWSPEIADEKKDRFYLNTGEGNVNAIIISPDQQGQPVYMPFHSFDRDIMDAVFKAYPGEIRDITRDAALIAQVDQHLDVLYDPLDLLRYESIEVRFSLLYDLQQKQREQLELVAIFNTKHNFIDREIHGRLLESSRPHGDLRERKLSLEPLKLQVSSFYTRAYGGVFILKEFIKPIMVFEDETAYNKAIKDTVQDVLMFHVKHDELIATLVRHLILEADHKEALGSDRYTRIRNHIVSGLITNKSHSLKEIFDNHLLFQRYLNGLDPALQKMINGVALYFQKRPMDASIKIDEYMDTRYFKALHKPHSSLERKDQELVWKLLVKIMPVDPVYLYLYDKDQFYSTFDTWDADYQEWAIAKILEQLKIRHT